LINTQDLPSIRSKPNATIEEAIKHRSTTKARSKLNVTIPEQNQRQHPARSRRPMTKILQSSVTKSSIFGQKLLDLASCMARTATSFTSFDSPSCTDSKKSTFVTPAFNSLPQI
jgi:hypothetical protein